MTTIETEKSISPNNISLLYGFLTDLSNYEKLMPSDKIENWEANQEQCSFVIKGMSRIGLKLKDSEHPNKVILESNGKVPFDFELQLLLREQAEEQTAVQIIFHGKINPFMKMMVEQPLKNFFDQLVKKASDIKL